MKTDQEIELAWLREIVATMIGRGHITIENHEPSNESKALLVSATELAVLKKRNELLQTENDRLNDIMEKGREISNALC